MVNYKRYQTVIEGPSTGPFEISNNVIEMSDGVLTQTTRSYKVTKYRLDWEEEDVLG